jgi:hypothetical protein
VCIYIYSRPAFQWIRLSINTWTTHLYIIRYRPDSRENLPAGLFLPKQRLGPLRSAGCLECAPRASLPRFVLLPSLGVLPPLLQTHICSNISLNAPARGHALTNATCHTGPVPSATTRASRPSASQTYLRQYMSVDIYAMYTLTFIQPCPAGLFLPKQRLGPRRRRLPEYRANGHHALPSDLNLNNASKKDDHGRIVGGVVGGDDAGPLGPWPLCVLLCGRALRAADVRRAENSCCAG